MELDALKTMIEESPLSPAGREAADDIMANAIAEGGFSSEQKEQLIALVTAEKSEREALAASLFELVTSLDDVIQAARIEAA